MSPAAGPRILVVDDEPAIRRAVSTNLARHDFRVEEAETGQEALDLYASFRPDVIVLDLSLPDFDGLYVIERVRERSSTPIIILSVRGGERDKVSALDLGADDYLTKPFSVNELLARIRVALRHVARPTSAGVFRTGDLEVDLEHRRVRLAGTEVDLSPTEYDLLKVFVAHPDRVLTHAMLVHDVWGPEYGTESHYLHVYVARLRKKLEADPQRPRYFITEPGVGYRLVADEGLVS
ncbi:MAG TPA: response regulator transcription factor [Dehalococcoidia bacterium]|nr:response regulator transcription factor [Dehalococcoidia bacterium]